MIYECSWTYSVTTLFKRSADNTNSKNINLEKINPNPNKVPTYDEKMKNNGYKS